MSEALLERAREFDAADPLADFREQFLLPDGVIYLDGNSLGALPRATPARLEQVIRSAWGEGLIRSWNDSAWIGSARRVGGTVAPLRGARPGREGGVEGKRCAVRVDHGGR